MKTPCSSSTNTRKSLAALALLTALLFAGFPLGSALSLKGGNHGSISIMSDADFTPAGSATGCSCVSSGTGTLADPFVIGPWTIMATSTSAGISFEGTSLTKHFLLLHITIHGTHDNDGIILTKVNGLGSIQAANINGARNGISLDHTSGVTITGNSLNNNFRWGIKLSDSDNNKMTFMTISHNGLVTPEPNEPGEAADAFLGHEFGGGVLFLNSDHNELSDSILAEDAYAGFVMIRSDHNTVRHVNSRYPDYYGGVLQDSSHNTLDRFDSQTADFGGLIIRGGGFNTVQNSDFSANGPIGNEWNAHTVPYFIAGLYLGWGTHDNRIIFSHSNNGNTGPGLLVDDGTIINPIQSPVQDLNPLNDASGNDLGTIPAGSAFGTPGQPTNAGTGNIYCGNSFATTNLTTDPNAPCP